MTEIEVVFFYILRCKKFKFKIVLWPVELSQCLFMKSMC